MINYDFIDGKEPDARLAADIEPVTKIDPFDLDRAKQHFAVFESKIKDWAKEVESADIKSETDATAFTDTIGKAKSLIKKFETTRKDITAEAYGFYKDVMGFEKYYTNMINEKVVDPANSKLSFYFKQIQIEHQKAEKAAQEAAAAKQKELDEIADAAGVDRVELDKPVFKEDKPKIAGEAATAHIREKWDYKVIDFEQIPIDYLMVDDKAVKQAIKNGERRIAGIEIFKEVSAQVRARR